MFIFHTGTLSQTAINAQFKETRTYFEKLFNTHVATKEAHVAQALVREEACKQKGVVGDGSHRLELLQKCSPGTECFPTRIVFPNSLEEFINISHGIHITCLSGFIIFTCRKKYSDIYRFCVL